MFQLRLKFHWSLFPRVQLTIFQHWFRWWLGAVQPTSHYLNQWWPGLITHIRVNRPQWVKGNCSHWLTGLIQMYKRTSEMVSDITMVSCQKGPTRHAYSWQIRPFWHDTLDYVSAGVDSGYAHIRCQSIIQTNDGLFSWRVYVSPDHANQLHACKRLNNWNMACIWTYILRFWIGCSYSTLPWLQRRFG